MPTSSEIIDLIHKTIESYIDDCGGDPYNVDTLDLAENIAITLANRGITNHEDVQ